MKRLVISIGTGLVLPLSLYVLVSFVRELLGRGSNTDFLYYVLFWPYITPYVCRVFPASDNTWTLLTVTYLITAAIALGLTYIFLRFLIPGSKEVPGPPLPQDLT